MSPGRKSVNIGSQDPERCSLPSCITGDPLSEPSPSILYLETDGWNQVVTLSYHKIISSTQQGSGWVLTSCILSRNHQTRSSVVVIPGTTTRFENASSIMAQTISYVQCQAQAAESSGGLTCICLYISSCPPLTLVDTYSIASMGRRTTSPIQRGPS